ncbi:hypothetical protein EMIT0324P_30192 [Pseudomonas chlororaphis]
MHANPKSLMKGARILGPGLRRTQGQLPAERDWDCAGRKKHRGQAALLQKKMACFCRSEACPR